MFTTMTIPSGVATRKISGTPASDSTSTEAFSGAGYPDVEALLRQRVEEEIKDKLKDLFRR